MYACICINNILDININSTQNLTSSGGIEALCVCMQNFNYIDIAESAIKALEKISINYPDYVMRAGAFEKMMNMINFFFITT